jgi:hypothetical protein
VSEGAGTRVFGEEMQDARGFDKAPARSTLTRSTGAVAIVSNTAAPPLPSDLGPRIEQPFFLITAHGGA